MMNYYYSINPRLTTSMSRGALGNGIWGDTVRQTEPERCAGGGGGEAAAVAPPPAAVVAPPSVVVVVMLHTGGRWLSQPTVELADTVGGGAANTLGHSQIPKLTPPPPGTFAGDVRTRRGMTSLMRGSGLARWDHVSQVAHNERARSTLGNDHGGLQHINNPRMKTFFFLLREEYLFFSVSFAFLVWHMKSSFW